MSNSTAAATPLEASDRPAADAMPLEVSNISCGYKGTAVIKGLSFSIEPGEVCAILGQNGIGKTTIFKSILRHIPLLDGSVRIYGNDCQTLSHSRMAQLVGYVPQGHTPPFSFTVAEIVEMGRTAHLPVTAVPSSKDRMIALEAMNDLGIAHLHDKPYTQISGGERQLTLIARALCQQAKLLIMDEPCANLDFGNKARVLDQIRRLAELGNTILFTTHDPDHALSTATSVVAIAGESEFEIGKPSEIITNELLEKLYGVPAQVSCVQTPRGSSYVTIPV